MSTFQELAKIANLEEEITEITEKGINGEINWEDGLKKRIELLKGKITYKEASQVAEKMELMDGAQILCKKIKEKGWPIAIITGGFHIVADRVKEELGIDYVFANELLFDGETLKDIKIEVNGKKELNLLHLIKQKNIHLKDTAVIADGANDLTMLLLAGLKIAFNPKPIIKKHADFVIEEKNLAKLIPIFKLGGEIDGF